MKLRVAFWDYYDSDEYEEGEDGWASRMAVVDDIVKNGYMFSGFDHQELLNCAPVLNDGKIRRFSQRGFGDVMAEAHGYYGDFDYVMFMMDTPEERNIPKSDYSEFVPETDLNETFILEVTRDIFNLARTGKVKMYDLKELRYIDVGDTFILTCEGERQSYLVEDVVRRYDRDKQNKENLDVPPTILTVTLKSI